MSLVRPCILLKNHEKVYSVKHILKHTEQLNKIQANFYQNHQLKSHHKINKTYANGKASHPPSMTFRFVALWYKKAPTVSK